MQRLTFKDFKKRVSLEIAQQQSKLFERLQNKPFWIWNIREHKQEDIKTNGDCCFNHIIGLPQKDACDKPLFEYEKIIFDLVTQNGKICYERGTVGRFKFWIAKTSFLLRNVSLTC
jgi:hypothetical protein